MSQPRLYINIILDKSGSMASCKDETIAGFNAYIKDQKTDPKGEIFVSLTQFASKPTVVYTAKPIEMVENLNADSYAPEGGTALLDAVGYSVSELDKVLARETDKPVILCVILTDGQENESKEFTKESISALIKKKEDEGNWTFVFLGAELSKWHGQQIGTAYANSMSYAKSNTAQAMGNLSSSTKQLYAGAIGSSLRGAAVLNTKNFYNDPGWRGIDIDPDDTVADPDETAGPKDNQTPPIAPPTTSNP